MGGWEESQLRQRRARACAPFQRMPQPQSGAARLGAAAAAGACPTFTVHPCCPRWASSRFGVGDDTSDWRVTKIVVSGKLKSNESVLFQVGAGTCQLGCAMCSGAPLCRSAPWDARCTHGRCRS